MSSKIKTLKTDPENNINIIDILSLVIPNEKIVYIETLIRLMKNSNNYNEVNDEIKAYLQKEFKANEEKMDEIPHFHLMFYYKFIESLFVSNDLNVYQKFIEYNERKLIENNDIAKYTSFDEIKNAVNIVDLKLSVKELEKQTVKVFEDNEFLIIRPLTYLSSKKYGSNTKWCTTANSEYTYFRRYSTDGILLYIINKINGVKIASYYSLVESTKEFSFWNQVDTRIDSMETELPQYILDIIKTEITENRRTNRSYLTKSEIEKDDSLNKSEGKSMSGDFEERAIPAPHGYVNEREVQHENDQTDMVVRDMAVREEVAQPYRGEAEQINASILFGVNDTEAGRGYLPNS